MPISRLFVGSRENRKKILREGSETSKPQATWERRKSASESIVQMLKKEKY